MIEIDENSSSNASDLNDTNIIGVSSEEDSEVRPLREINVRKVGLLYFIPSLNAELI